MIEVIKKEQYKVSNWSGGTTTEIYLAPQDGSYAQRCFDFRISSATVDLEESDFTPLANVNRYLTILEGEMDLTFQEEEVRKVTLKPYEVVEFSGDVPTHSVGKAKDFNLMLKGCKGVMETFFGGGFSLEVAENTQVFVYSVGNWYGIINGEEISVNGEDTLHLSVSAKPVTMEVLGKGNDTQHWVVLEVCA